MTTQKTARGGFSAYTNLELLGATEDQLSDAAHDIYRFRGYEGKIIAVTEGCFAGRSEDIIFTPPLNIKIESCDEFEPTDDAHCDLSFYGVPATEADWNHPDLKDFGVEERKDILIRVVGIIVNAENGEVREYYWKSGE